MEEKMDFNRDQQVWSQSQSQAASIDAGLRGYMLSVYNYMASALVLTGITAWLGANFAPVMNLLYKTQDGYLVGMTGLGWVVAFAPIALVMWLGIRIQHMSFGKAQAIFWSYAGLVGLSLSALLFVYTAESIARVFFITAGMFGGLSLYGYSTKRDLTGMGSFLIMGVIGLFLVSLANMYFESSAVSLAVSVIGVGLFAGLTAYDTQKIKNNYYAMQGSAEATMKSALMGALSLYMDFVNLFVMLLRLVGDRRE
jgi:uncharacterized protein